MADLDGLVATHWRELRLESWDRESLLVDWLNELLFLTETEGLLFVEWRIESLTDRELVARVGGAPAPVTRAGIKAATFHDLALRQDESGWFTTITFDV
jgi:SHS2 domain-containing protein